MAGKHLQKRIELSVTCKLNSSGHTSYLLSNEWLRIRIRITNLTVITLHWTKYHLSSSYIVIFCTYSYQRPYELCTYIPWRKSRSSPWLGWQNADEGGHVIPIVNTRPSQVSHIKIIKKRNIDYFISSTTSETQCGVAIPLHIYGPLAPLRNPAIYLDVSGRRAEEAKRASFAAHSLFWRIAPVGSLHPHSRPKDTPIRS